MRISDWGSDVCSSDLQDSMSGAAADRGGATAQPAGPEPASAGTSWGRLPLATAVLSLPTLLVLAVLLAAGLLPVAAAAGGAVVVLALVAVLLHQHFRRVRALTRYLGRKIGREWRRERVMPYM